MKSIKLDSKLYDYLLDMGVREAPILAEIREYAEQQPRAKLLSTPDTAQLLQMLVRLTKAESVLEIGTFLGYGATAIALALPEAGRVVTCELEKDYADIAQSFWNKAELQDKIECRIGDALKTLSELNDESFDFVFIDADKSNYVAYYEESLRLLKQGGCIAIDNVFFQGRVIDATENSNGTKAIRELNKIIINDERVDIATLTVGDGVTLVFKR